MDTPFVMDPIAVTRDTHALSTYLPVPGLGVLPVNAFVIEAAEPVLVDAGVLAMRDAFLAQLARVIDPRALRWIWLTHTDADHAGALAPLLELAPDARVVTTFLGLGKLNLQGPWPAERFYLLNPGQALEVGDRQLVAMRPPVYDAPETTAAFDTRTRALYSADAFGAVLEAPLEAAEDVSPAALREGMVTWTTVDAPWIADLAPGALRRALAVVDELRPGVVLSGHLPPARGINRALSDAIIAASTASPFVGPDQQEMLRAAVA